VDARDYDGQTALHRAAQLGDVAEIETLLAKGASIDAPASRGGSSTPLEVALEHDKPEAARRLIEHGASLAGDNGARALALAARNGDDATLSLLLKRGVPAGPSQALAYAARSGQVAAMKVLIKAGAVVDGADAKDHARTALIEACEAGQLEAARVLLDAGARIDLRDDEGRTPLHWAVRAARPVELHLYPPGEGLHATVFQPQASAPLVAMLVARGAKLELADDEGNTPLHVAAFWDAAAAARVLIRAGAKRFARNAEGKTPLDLAQDATVVDVLRSR
jgi:ankyrin repeat protein